MVIDEVARHSTNKSETGLEWELSGPSIKRGGGDVSFAFVAAIVGAFFFLPILYSPTGLTADERVAYSSGAFGGFILVALLFSLMVRLLASKQSPSKYMLKKNFVIAGSVHLIIWIFAQHY
ncbi:hypothetical protein [Algiphilus sp.]|uniref:hypothetical protein n=1 Tax=Algiphilus sp. TaxID=1872431 RepID=UPI003B515EB6